MISVIIPALNEIQAELNATVESIRLTAEEEVEIIVVDDCSSSPIPPGDYRLMHLKHRVGGGAARHTGAIRASGDILVFTDSHCRFAPGWTKALSVNIRPHAKRLVCGRMLALDHTTDRLDQHKGEYYGGKMILHDPAEKLNRRILASKWRPAHMVKKRHGDSLAETFEITACMGACYAIARTFFFDISGMSLLHGFGCEEEFLSMKTMLAGGDIIWARDFAVGHRFREKGAKLPYRLETWELYYNTMVVAYVCCPTSVADELISTLGLDTDIQRAKEHVKLTWNSISAEMTRLQTWAFRLDWPGYKQMLKIIDG